MDRRQSRLTLSSEGIAPSVYKTLLEAAADKGHTEACNYYGAHLCGSGNYDHALRYLSSAAEHDEPLAVLFRRQCGRSGPGAGVGMADEESNPVTLSPLAAGGGLPQGSYRRAGPREDGSPAARGDRQGKLTGALVLRDGGQGSHWQNGRGAAAARTGTLSLIPRLDSSSFLR